MPRREIAARRGISINAVKYHARNIAGKLGVDSAHDLRQWPGQPFDSALRRARETHMDEPVRLGPVGQVSLLMTDVARAEAFYRDTLGLPHFFTFGDLAFFQAGDVRLYLHRVGEADFRPSSVLYFRVPDIEAAHRDLTARGVRFGGAAHLVHRHDTGDEEWMAFFEDGEGNTLALMSLVPGAPAAVPAAQA